MGTIVIVGYKPKAGKETTLNGLVKTHASRLRKEGLVTDRPQVIMQANDGTIIEVFEWVSADAIAGAHQNAEVQKMWGEFAEACEYVPLNQLKETADMFASFAPVE